MLDEEELEETGISGTGFGSASALRVMKERCVIRSGAIGGSGIMRPVFFGIA